MKLRCWLFGHDWEEHAHTRWGNDRPIVTKYKICKRCREPDTAAHVLAARIMARMGR